ncbi:TOG array regulator of axonemal microtubules protein 1 [Clupea harengus]|uniref:TOG array regulator of axonemal microtubules protein 1 n=1 Tax=Clupea harengus TaxID=7950 RepID=A0A6P8GFM1_CLUHA|nr:TOG array regulator of axonemal microtubules protein 1 [Clupea harengus]
MTGLPSEPSIMIYGLIPQELHDQLLDYNNYQNRTNGVEELKNILFELDLKPVPSDSIDEFISFIRKLLDDSNFKVLYGTLQVINLLVQKLDYNVEKYCKQIVCVALKTLGDTRAVTRNEYMNVFRQLMRIVGPQKVLDLVIGHLRHKNSRVREDVLNIITAAMLTHPRKDFNISSLCFEVAPYLADSKRKVRHAALELFAVFDYCLDTGKKQPLMKAIDRVELTADVEGLMAAVQARKARHMLPRVSAEGMVEYSLIIPKPGQRRSSQFGSGADVDWVLNGGRSSSARSQRTEPDTDRLCGYGSLGSLTDDFPLHRRIMSAGKGKNKLPWERTSLPCAPDPQPSSPSSRKPSSKISSSDDMLSSYSSHRGMCVSSFGSGELAPSSGRWEHLGRLRRSGSLDSDPDIFKAALSSDTDRVFPKPGRLLSGNPSVERTFSLPSNPPGSFLLPSYPLASLPGGILTPTLSRQRRADSLLSMSNTWPNKRESSPQRRDTSPWRDCAGEVLSSRCSPLPLRASLVSSSSTSSFRQALSSSRPVSSLSPVSPVTPITPVMALPDRGLASNGQRTSRHEQQQVERRLHLDLANLGLQDQEEEPLNREEMLNSLRSLRNSAAKKRAKVSHSGSEPDPDSPDSAVRLEPSLDSPSYMSPSVTSPMSESGLSSLCLPQTPTPDGTQTSPGNSTTKSRSARVSSSKQRPAVSMEFASLQALPPKDKGPSEVSVIGQRVTYHNGPAEPEVDRGRQISPLTARPTGREPIRALRPAKAPQILSSCSRASPAGDMSEGVVGKGVFGPVPPSSCPGVPSSSSEHGDSPGRLTCDPPTGVYGHAVPGGQQDSDSNADSEEATERVNMSKLARDKMRQHRLDQQDGPQPPADRQRIERIRHRTRNMMTDSCTEESGHLRDFQLNGSVVASTKSDSTQDDVSSSPTSPPGPQSPIKCFSPAHQPSPPTVPPTSRSTLPRLRRAPSLTRARPSLSQSTDELAPGTPCQKKDLQEQPELRPFSKPELALTQSFKLLSSDDWEKKIEGLTFMRCLTQYHSDVLSSRLHDVCLALIQEVKNLRSGVSRVALVTVGELFSQLQRGMDQELDVVARALLNKASESNAFIRQDVDAALDSMVQHCTLTRTMNALLTGVSHLNSVVRKCTGQHMATLVEKIGASRVLSGGKDLTDRILPAVTRLAQDSSQEARFFGRRMLLFLSSHRDFDKMLEKYTPPKELATVRDTVFTLKTKGLGEMPQDTPSARGRRSIPGSGTIRASSLTREPLSSSKDYGQLSSKGQAHSIADKTEYIKQLTGLLNSKDFRERIKGIDQLVGDCEYTPNLVIGSMFQVFDAFKARLQESNSKVNLYALEALPRIISLLKDNLAQVVYILVPAIVDNHLNSKNNAIYSAAIGAIDELIQNLDNSPLLLLFCTKAQYLSGKAKVDLIEKVAELVRELYPRKPQMVEQKVLPLLWHLLGASTNSGTVHGRGGSVRVATTNLCQALYDHMGPALAECAASQPSNTHKSLNELLNSLNAPH